ncbi:hypothetical protein [Erythrobacter dokdonensis]|uniref:Uncharacterized protein n=1 Tax=Erythrobacter dokdonensis DSW-74 TaxID=1300349 RepID=A0A1A7BJ11_9SPHN|nr:hypothetical protein [Erythrobacter dokdonensis]OBV11190.1 hypothetical protein I603_1598 [Erythrobacter dokdonensis DSW-74]
MIGRLTWLASLLAFAVLTAFLQIDRQADMTPSLAPTIPQPLRNYAQPRIAAAAAESTDTAKALEEAKRLVRRRPVPAEHLTLLAVAQTKAGQAEQAGMTIQIAAQRGWREPIAQEAVLRLALAAGDEPEAARRFAALFLRRATPNGLLQELAPAVLDQTNGPGQRTLVDIINGTDRWHNTFLRRGIQVMTPAAFADIATASMARGTQFDCAILSQTLKALRQTDAASADRVADAALEDCPQLGA